jgi:hypothetical protein
MSKEEFILACLILLTGFHSWSTKKWSLIRLVARMEPIVVRYYEDLVQNNVALDEKKVMPYPDFEKLHRRIKK